MVVINFREDKETKHNKTRVSLYQNFTLQNSSGQGQQLSSKVFSNVGNGGCQSTGTAIGSSSYDKRKINRISLNSNKS